MTDYTYSSLAKNFYGIQGCTLPEKRKNLFKLLHATSKANDLKNIDKAIKEIKPRNLLETRFKTELIIFFNYSKETLNILKSGDQISASLIFKYHNIFKNAFELMPPNVIVNEFLPELSYVIRMKVIKMLGRTSPASKVDEIYDAVAERYGIFTALLTLVDSCTTGKIETEIQNFNVTLKYRQLLILYNKNPDLLEMYLKQRKRNNSVQNLDKLLNVIALDNPTYYCEFVKKFNFNHKLGKRTTKKFVDEKKSDILTNPCDFEFLKLPTLTRRLQYEYKIVFSKKFPVHISQAETYRIVDLLKYYPQRHKFNLLKQTFALRFGKNIWDNLHWIDSRIFHWMSREDKEKWSKIKYNQSKDPVHLKYFDLPEAVRLHKELINFASTTPIREKLLTSLIFSVAGYHNNLNELSEILKYICERHRNETTYVYENVIRKIKDNTDLKLLKEDHWKSIMDLFLIARLKKSPFHIPEVNLAYLEFLWKQNKPIREEYKQYLSDNQSYYNTWFFDVKNATFEKELLLLAVDLVPEIKTSDSEENFVSNTHENLIEKIHDFNKREPSLQINILEHPALFDSIQKLLQPESYKTPNSTIKEPTEKLLFTEQLTDNEKRYLNLVKNYFMKSEFYLKNPLKELFEKTNRSPLDNGVLKRIWNTYKSNSGTSLLNRWLLTYSPKTLEQVTLSSPQISLQKDSYNILKYYEYLNVYHKIIKDFKKAFEDDSNAKSAIKLLASTMKPDDFVDYVKKYVPTSAKLNLEDEKKRMIYDKQCLIGECFKLMYSTNVEIVLKWALGDYLKYTLPSVYSAFYRTPEKDLLGYIKRVNLGAVSVRKHALFLASVLMNLKTVNMLIYNNSMFETNISSKKHLVKTVRQCFIRNPSQQLYDLFKNSLKFVDRSDVETMEALERIKEVNKTFRSDYFEDVLNFFESQIRHGGLVDNHICHMINNVDVPELKKIVCLRFIQTHFMVSEKKINEASFNFVHQFLQHFDDDQSHEFVFNIMHRIWDEKSDRESLKKFFQDFVKVTNNMTTLNHAYIQSCCKEFGKIFEPVTWFNSYLLNKLINLKGFLQMPMDDELANGTLKVAEEVIEEFGLIVLDKIVELVKKASSSHIQSVCYFTYCLIKDCPTNKVACLMAAELSRTWILRGVKDERTEYREKIVTILKEHPDKTVQLYANLID